MLDSLAWLLISCKFNGCFHHCFFAGTVNVVRNPNFGKLVAGYLFPEVRLTRMLLDVAKSRLMSYLQDF
jgi:hypothetical protein